MTQGRMSYDLRRLRLHGLIERIPGTHRYTVTDRGLRLAIFLTRVHTRLIRPGLSQALDDFDTDTALRRQLDRLDASIEAEAQRHKLIA
jgi:Mn-dependent DtxR family transcriptional regulator